MLCSRTYHVYDDANVWGNDNICMRLLCFSIGYPRAPRSISGRILTAFWWIFIVIFLMCYTAKLVFYLNQFPVQGNRATSGQAESEGSLDALMKEGYTFGVVKNSPTYYFFRQSRIPTYQKVWSRMEDAPNASFVETPNDGYKKAMDGNFAFLTSSLSADYALQNEPCSLMTVGGLLTSQGVGLAVSTGSPIAEKLNEAILEMRESGTIHKLYQKWWEQSGRCPKHAASVGVGGIQASELKLSEFGGAYILLIIGAVLAAIALLLEILFSRRQKKKVNQNHVFLDSAIKNSNNVTAPRNGKQSMWGADISVFSWINLFEVVGRHFQIRSINLGRRAHKVIRPHKKKVTICP